MNQSLKLNPGVLQRAQGAWLGQLIGDALGSQVEFESADAIRRRYPDGLRTLGPSPVFGTIAGQPTDDSEMALMLARCLIEHRTYDPEVVISGYCWWLESRPFDVGITTGRALRAGLVAGDGENRAGVAQRGADPDSQSNGALMRESPLAIWGHTLTADELARIVRQDVCLTHPNSVCQDASVAYVAALAAAVREGLDAEQTYAVALDTQNRLGSSRQVSDALAAARRSAPQFQPHEGWVLIALQNAFYQALHAGSFEGGVVNTVMGGGDTDTNAAVAGALLGGIYGVQSIPPAWIETIATCRPSATDPTVRRPRPERLWPCDAVSLAAELVQAAPSRNGEENARSSPPETAP